MLRASLFAIASALFAIGLFAQDDLAQYQEHMKAAAKSSGAIRKAIASGDAAAAKTEATNTATAFDWIAKFWEGKGKTDAVGFAKAASEAAKAVAAASTPEDMTAAAGKINPNCQGCHAVYRAGSAFKGM
jgi:cytochrome c556